MRCWPHAEKHPERKYFISASDEKFKQIVHAAIRAAVNDHGPITHELSGSFSKRLMGLLRDRTVRVTKMKLLEILAGMTEGDAKAAESEKEEAGSG